MSDTTELVQSTIDKVLERVDKLADKLGIAAAEIWKFSVTAKAVKARAEMAKSAAPLLISLILFGWAIHVARMPLPHESKPDGYENVRSAPLPCDQIGTLNGKQVILHEQCWQNEQKERMKDDGLSQNGWILLASAVLCVMIGLLLMTIGVESLIDGYAATKTAEYDAYQDLLYDLKD